MDGERFLEFINKVLAKELAPGDTAVMHNLS